jgi:hypothetical protein
MRKFNKKHIKITILYVLDYPIIAFTSYLILYSISSTFEVTKNIIFYIIHIHIHFLH